MQQDNKRHETQSVELRSEKVRSIVGQIPSALLRYGITAIGGVMLCLFCVAYFLPYKQVYAGTATVHRVPITTADSTMQTVLLRFAEKRPSDLHHQQLLLQSPQGTVVGCIQSLSATRDTLERQKAQCRFLYSDIKAVENQTVDFQIVHSSGNLLQKMLGGL